MNHACTDFISIWVTLWPVWLERVIIRPSPFNYWVATHEYVSSSTLIPQILNPYRLLAEEIKVFRSLIEVATRFYFTAIGSFVYADVILNFSIPRPKWMSHVYIHMKDLHLMKFVVNFVLRSYSRRNWIRVSTMSHDHDVTCDVKRNENAGHEKSGLKKEIQSR